MKSKIPLVAIFPYTNSNLKNNFGHEALNENNLVCRAIRLIKKKYKNKIGIMCDVALDLIHHMVMMVCYQKEKF